MNDPLITVILPTRERSDTLKWALKTCVDQAYPNLRILVSDNFSADDTKQVVDYYNDPRVSYINTGERLGMSQNWEFAMQHVNEGYVMYLGDDDGLLPNAIDRIAAILRDSDPDALTWKYNTYYWPEFGIDSQRNNVTVSFKKGLEWRDSKKALASVLRFESHWDTLPFLYTYGIVKVAVLKRALSKAPRVFSSRIPDVFSSILLGTLSEKFLHSHQPYSIGGISRHSTGLSQSGIKSEKSNEIDPAKKFETESNLPFHPELEYTHTAAVLIGESYFQVRENFPEIESIHKLTVEAILSNSLLEVRGYDLAKREKTLPVLQSIARKHGLKNIEAQIENFPASVPGKITVPTVYGFHISKTGAILDGSKFDVRNVYDAALLCSLAESFERNGLISMTSKITNAFRTIRKRGIKLINDKLS